MTPPDELLDEDQSAGWRFPTVTLRAVAALAAMLQAPLLTAIYAARFHCVECQSGVITIEYVRLLEQWQPVVTHWPVAPGQWCPVTWGGRAARLASLDLLDSLAGHMLVGDYGEPIAWHRRERVSP